MPLDDTFTFSKQCKRYTAMAMAASKSVSLLGSSSDFVVMGHGFETQLVGNQQRV